MKKLGPRGSKKCFGEVKTANWGDFLSVHTTMYAQLRLENVDWWG